MKEELQSRLVEILTSIQTAAGKASDFALAELPDIAQSYIVYGRVAHTVAAVAGVILLLAAAWCFLRFQYHQKMYWQTSGKEEAEHSAAQGPFILGAVGGALIGLVLSAANVQSAFLVWFAPKVWLLKEIAGMLK